MIKTIIFTKEEKFVEEIKVTAANVVKQLNFHDEVKIKQSTDDSKKIIWNLDNNINNKDINLYIVDLDNNKKEGLELARNVRKKDSLGYIVFVSSINFEARELLAKGIKPSGFFMKPIGTFEFVDLLNEIIFDKAQVIKAKNNYTEGHIIVKSDYKNKVVFLTDIIAIEYAKPKSIIETIYGTIRTNSSLTDLFSDLEDEDKFGTIVRTHNSFIVNLTNVEVMDYRNLQITMKKGITIPISRSRKKEVISALESTICTKNLSNIKIKK